MLIYESFIKKIYIFIYLKIVRQKANKEKLYR